MTIATTDTYWLPEMTFTQWTPASLIYLRFPYFQLERAEFDQPPNTLRVPATHLMYVRDDDYVAFPFIGKPPYALFAGRTALSPDGWKAYRTMILAGLQARDPNLKPERYEGRVAARMLTVRHATWEYVQAERARLTNTLRMLNNGAALELGVYATPDTKEFPHSMKAPD